MKMKITCKEATDFISKKEEGKLSLLQLVQLWMHLGICGLCKFFYKQNKMIIKQTAMLDENTEATLSTDEKQTIINTLNEIK